jgi:AcrR family transcriptional regulator
MANIDPVRRAEIGREKRARTRAQLIAAATKLFAKRAVESVTVDEVVEEAGVAKGTFYVHFEDLRELTTAVAEELVASFDDLLQPVRLSLKEPALRIAFGCSCFLDKALTDPGWAGVVARMVAAAPNGGEVARHRVFEDLRAFSRGLPRGGISPQLSLEIVAGIMLQLLSAIAEGRLTSRDREPAIEAILRAIGLDAGQVKSVLARVPARQNLVADRAIGDGPKSRRRPRADRAP